MTRAFELGDVPCAQLLYEERGLKDKSKRTADDALRFAVQNGHETLVRLVAGDRLDTTMHQFDLQGAVLEDACRAHSTSMVYFLLNVASTRPISACGPTWNSLYWAGRSGNVDILRIVLRKFVREPDRHFACILDALAGAAFHSLEAVECVLEHAGCATTSMNTASNGLELFFQAADRVMTHRSQAPGISDGFDDHQEHEKTRQEGEYHLDRPPGHEGDGGRRPLEELEGRLRECEMEKDVEWPLKFSQWLSATRPTVDADSPSAIAIAHYRPGLLLLTQKDMDVCTSMRDLVSRAADSGSTAMFSALRDAAMAIDSTSLSHRRIPLLKFDQHRPVAMHHHLMKTSVVFRSALWDARSRPHLTRWFIANVPSPNKCNGISRSLRPLGYAMRSISSLKLLVAHGGDIRRGYHLSRVTSTGDLETLDWLLGHALPPDGDPVPGKSSAMLPPLWCAARRGNADGCELLLRHGADVNVRTHVGETARAIAQDLNHRHVVDVLRRWEEREVESS